jgi:two-component system, cell cycle sensor histidine kinase and response regulator CckA
MASLYFAAAAATAWMAVGLSPTPYRLELAAFGAVAFAFGIVIIVLPWHRWPHPLIAVIPAVGIALMVVNAASGVQGAATYAMFLLLILLWVGFALPSWYALPFALVGGVTYAIAYPAGTGPSGAAAEAVALASVSLIVALSIAWWARQIRHSEARLRDAQNAANLGSWEWIPASDRFRSSEYLHHVFGEPDPGRTGSLETYLSWVHPDDRDAVRRRLEAAVVSGQPFRFDHRSMREHGPARVMEIRGRVVRVDSRRGVRLVGTAQDVTELREADQQRRELEAERAAHASEARYRQFFEEDLTGNFVTTVDGVILDCNAALADFFGFESAEALRGENVKQFYLDLREREQMLQVLREQGKVERAERQFRRRDGTVVTAILNSIPDLDEDGELIGVRSYLFDITDRKLLEERLGQAQRLEAVGRLAGGMAHDFNNVLAAIQGHVEIILADTPEDSPIREDIEVIRGSAERATSITRQLLAFTRQQVLRPRVVDLSVAVLDIARIVRRLIGTGIELQVVEAPAPCLVRVDPGQVEQILMNLAANARDAMPDGGRLTFRVSSGEITLSEAERHPYTVVPGNYAILTVSDTGLGMDPTVRERAFEPFFTTKSVGQGTGLGLPMVYGIVKQSGGYIWIDSEPGAGSRFRMYFPLVADAESVDADPSPAEPSVGLSGTVLVAEDEPAVRSFIRRVLERKGFDVLEAANAEEAIRLFSGRTVDVLLTDMVMPGMGGGELAERLIREAPSLRIVYMSGHTEDEVVRRGSGPEARRFLQKPFSHRALIEAVTLPPRGGPAP